MRRTHITALLALSLLAADNTVAQPASALHPGSGTAGNAPATSLHGPASVPTTSGQPAQAWSVPAAASKVTDVHATEPSALQKADLPADLARLSDSAIIIIGGKPTTAGEVKRAVLNLDDKAIIIIGGKQVAAAAMKRELQASGAHAQPAATPASPARHASAPSVAVQRVTVVSPRRAALMRESQAIREEQDRLADAVARNTPDKPNPVGTPAGASPWPQAPYGTRALQTSEGKKVYDVNGVQAVNGRASGVSVTPGGKVVISGIGFGTTPADAWLTGGALEPKTIRLWIDAWTATQIKASVPSTARGFRDEPNAVVEVRTSAGAIYRFPGVGFIAAREETTITDPKTMADFVEWINTNSQWKDRLGRIGRASLMSGKSINCPQPGTDTIHFHVRRGFDPIGATMATGRTDSGDDDENGWAGSRVFTPGYSFGDWNNEDLKVNWGVFRSHTSPRNYAGLGSTRFVDDPWVVLVLGTGTVPVDRTAAEDVCRADWGLTSLTVWGPAGVTP